MRFDDVFKEIERQSISYEAITGFKPNVIIVGRSFVSEIISSCFPLVCDDGEKCYYLQGMKVSTAPDVESSTVNGSRIIRVGYAISWEY